MDLKWIAVLVPLTFAVGACLAVAALFVNSESLRTFLYGAALTIVIAVLLAAYFIQCTRLGGCY